MGWLAAKRAGESTTVLSTTVDALAVACATMVLSTAVVMVSLTVACWSAVATAIVPVAAVTAPEDPVAPVTATPASVHAAVLDAWLAFGAVGAVTVKEETERQAAMALVTAACAWRRLAARTLHTLWLRELSLHHLTIHFLARPTTTC